MGMDYFASRYDTIPEDVIKAEVPKELDAFYYAIKDAISEKMAVIEGDFEYTLDDVLDDFARETEHHDHQYDAGLDADDLKISMVAYDVLCEAFQAKTGLILHLGWVGEGLRGSDLHEERFWYIGNSDIPNPVRVVFEKRHGITVGSAWFMDAG